MKKKYDYISILAGGSCSFNCPFCIGNKIRKDEKPKYSKEIHKFLKEYVGDTSLLSISGSTSDPSLIGTLKKVKKEKQ